MSGMIDVVLKCSEDGQTDMRLVGLKVQEYTMSTCYFLGQRPEMILGLVPLSGCRPTGAEEAAAAGEAPVAHGSAGVRQHRFAADGVGH